MKKLILTLILIAFAINIKAQDIKTLPTFQVLKTDGTYFTQDNLKKDSRIMVIYFGSDCSHCKLYTKELLKHMDVLSKVQILMITWAQLKEIQDFYNEMGLAKYPNFIVTTEGHSAKLYRFYDVKTTPYTAVYDQKHFLVKTFDKSPVIDSLLATVSSSHNSPLKVRDTRW